jgi:hypothetical protein
MQAHRVAVSLRAPSRFAAQAMHQGYCPRSTPFLSTGQENIDINSPRDDELQRDWARQDTVPAIVEIVLTDRLLKE